MTIKQNGGIFGRKPTFSEVTADTFTGNLAGGVEGARATISYPTSGATVDLLTLGANNIAKVALLFVDPNSRQGVWAGEVAFFTSDASGSPALQGDVIEIFNQVGSKSWRNPVITIGNNTSTLTFNATNTDGDMNGNVLVYVYFCTDYNDLTFA